MQCRSLGRHWLLLLLMVACVGCERPTLEKTAERTRRQRRSRAARVAAVDCNVTVEDGQRFALQLQQAMDNLDALAAYRLIDWDSVIDVAIEGHEAPPNFHREMRKSFAELARNGRGFIGELVELLKNGASFSVVRVYSTDNSVGVWCRVLSAEGAPLYQDYRLGRGGGGDVLVKDVYSSNVGETLSSLLRPFLVQIMERGSQNLVARLTSETPLLIKHLPEFKRMKDSSAAGNHAAVVAIYRTLPEEVCRNKSVFMLYLESASQLTNEDWELAVNEANEFYQDGSLDAVLMFHMTEKGQYREAIACVDRLNRMIGGDLTLSAMRARLLIQAGKIDEAREQADLMIAWSPDIKVGYGIAIDIALQTKDFGALTRILDLMQPHGFSIPDIESLPDYADFVKSPQYDEWRREQQVAELPEGPSPEPEYSSWPRQL